MSTSWFSKKLPSHFKWSLFCAQSIPATFNVMYVKGRKFTHNMLWFGRCGCWLALIRVPHLRAWAWHWLQEPLQLPQAADAEFLLLQQHSLLSMMESQLSPQLWSYLPSLRLLVMLTPLAHQSSISRLVNLYVSCVTAGWMWNRFWYSW